MDRRHNTYHTWLERRLDLLCQQPRPINVPRKERVPLNLVGTVRSQTPVRFALQQAGHHPTRFRAHVRRKHERVAQDPLVHHVHIFVVEWWETGLGRINLQYIMHNKKKKWE